MCDNKKFNSSVFLPEQNTAEWLKWRKKMIGASDAPIIMGESPWKTPYKLWREKLGLDDLPQQTEAMRRGHELEPIAREKFEEITGHIVTPVTVIHSKYPWMMASLDGLSFCGTVMVEIKCPGERSHEEAKIGNIPAAYRAQLQHQLAVKPDATLYYFSFRDDDYALIKVEPDYDYQFKLILQERLFHAMVEEMTPPLLTDKDYVIKNDTAWQAATYDYRLAKETLDVAIAKEKAAKERLIELADGQSSMGCDIKVTRYMRKGAIEYEDIPELTNVDLNKYRKPDTECWRVKYDDNKS